MAGNFLGATSSSDVFNQGWPISPAGPLALQIKIPLGAFFFSIWRPSFLENFGSRPLT